MTSIWVQESTDCQVASAVTRASKDICNSVLCTLVNGASPSKSSWRPVKERGRWEDGCKQALKGHAYSLGLFSNGELSTHGKAEAQHTPTFPSWPAKTGLKHRQLWVKSHSLDKKTT